MGNPEGSQQKIEEEKQRKLKLALAQIEIQMAAHRKEKEGKKWMGTASRVCAAGSAFLFMVEMYLISKMGPDVTAAEGVGGAAPVEPTSLLPTLMTVGVLLIILVIASIVLSAMRKIE